MRRQPGRTTLREKSKSRVAEFRIHFFLLCKSTEVFLFFCFLAAIIDDTKRLTEFKINTQDKRQVDNIKNTMRHIKQLKICEHCT